MIKTQGIIHALAALVFPPICLGCGMEGEGDWCSACQADLPVNHPACQRCGGPVGDKYVVCGGCQLSPALPLVHRTFAPWRYDWPLDQWVKALKFKRRLAIARILGEAFAEAVIHQAIPLPEAIIPVPLHPNRLRQRGFNQAIELARPVATRLNIPLIASGLRRTRDTKPQMTLRRHERSENIGGAFALGHPLTVRHVALFDDILTTGETVNECAKVLVQAGVTMIQVWVCTRTRSLRLGAAPDTPF